MSEMNVRIPDGYKVTIKIEVESELGDGLRKSLYIRPDMRPKHYHDDLFHINQTIKKCVRDITRVKELQSGPD
jgi:hypothetical protein